MQKAFSFFQTVASSKKNKKKKKNSGEHSATSSLNKGSPSSEVHVSRVPKLHSAETD